MLDSDTSTAALYHFNSSNHFVFAFQRHPVASLMSKSAGDRFDLKPHSPTACASTNEDQETTTSSADKSKFVLRGICLYLTAYYQTP